MDLLYIRSPEGVAAHNTEFQPLSNIAAIHVAIYVRILKSYYARTGNLVYPFIGAGGDGEAHDSLVVMVVLLLLLLLIVIMVTVFFIRARSFLLVFASLSGQNFRL